MADANSRAQADLRLRVEALERNVARMQRTVLERERAAAVAHASLAQATGPQRPLATPTRFPLQWAISGGVALKTNAHAAARSCRGGGTCCAADHEDDDD